MWIENICSATWHSGKYDTRPSRSVQPSMVFNPRAAAPSPRQLICAALGGPVEPEVKTIRPMSLSDCMAASSATLPGCAATSARPDSISASNSWMPVRS